MIGSALHREKKTARHRTPVDLCLPPGSFLCCRTPTSDYSRPSGQTFRAGAIPVYLRAHDEVARFFDGLDVLDPGVVSISSWRPSTSRRPARRVGDRDGCAVAASLSRHPMGRLALCPVRPALSW